MKQLNGVHLSDVQAVYSGPEGQLWELIMGEQIHIGGLQTSLQLAEKAGIAPGQCGIDFCCCSGAGMRFLAQFKKVARMQGVDATPAVIERGRARTESAGLSARIEFVQSDVCRTPLPSGQADFVWGEDAWCYVEDKPALAREAARLIRAGGTVAFTDWVEGPAGLSDSEAGRFLKFMKFPNIEDLNGWPKLLEAAGLKTICAENTGRFAPYLDLYIEMLGKQLTYDALRLIDFNQPLLETLAGEMEFARRLAHAGKLAQGLFVARKL